MEKNKENGFTFYEDKGIISGKGEYKRLKGSKDYISFWFGTHKDNEVDMEEFIKFLDYLKEDLIKE